MTESLPKVRLDSSSLQKLENFQVNMLQNLEAIAAGVALLKNEKAVIDAITADVAAIKTALAAGGSPAALAADVAAIKATLAVILAAIGTPPAPAVVAAEG